MIANKVESWNDYNYTSRGTGTFILTKLPSLFGYDAYSFGLISNGNDKKANVCHLGMFKFYRKGIFP